MTQVLERQCDGWADPDADAWRALERVADLLTTFSTEIPVNVVIQLVAFGKGGEIQMGTLGSPMAVACLGVMVAEAAPKPTPAPMPAGYL